MQAHFVGLLAPEVHGTYVVLLAGQVCAFGARRPAPWVFLMTLGNFVSMQLFIAARAPRPMFSYSVGKLGPIGPCMHPLIFR